MSSIKRRLGMLAVATGAGLAAIAATGAAAHADTTLSHHIVPTFQVTDDAGQTVYFTGADFGSIGANSSLTWHYVRDMGGSRYGIERIDMWYTIQTDSNNNLTSYENVATAFSPSGNLSGYSSSYGWYYNGSNYDFVSVGTTDQFGNPSDPASVAVSGFDYRS
jgi:hypothetical protein